MCADDDGAFVVLQCAGNDFGSGGRACANQDGHRNGFQLGRQSSQRVFAAGGDVVFGSCFEYHAFFFVAAFGADNGDVRLQEGCGYADCAVEQAARVVAQVEDDAFERAFVFFDKGLCGFVERGNGALLELGDADVAVVFFKQVMAYAFDFDDGAGQVDDDGFVGIFA